MGRTTIGRELSDLRSVRPSNREAEAAYFGLSFRAYAISFARSEELILP